MSFCHSHDNPNTTFRRPEVGDFLLARPKRKQKDRTPPRLRPGKRPAHVCMPGGLGPRQTQDESANSLTVRREPPFRRTPSGRHSPRVCHTRPP